jgi:hypothetical protein
MQFLRLRLGLAPGSARPRKSPSTTILYAATYSAAARRLAWSPRPAKTRNRKTFIDFVPVQALAADLEAKALLRRGVEPARKPCERDTQTASVRQFHPRAVFVETSGFSRIGHARPFRSIPSIRATIASGAKQSRPSLRLLDCFVALLLAMTLRGGRRARVS